MVNVKRKKKSSKGIIGFNLAVFIIIILLLIFLHSKTISYQYSLLEFSQKISYLQQNISENVSGSLPALTTALEEFTPKIKSFMRFVFFWLPLVFFLAFIITQAPKYYLLSKKKKLKGFPNYLAQFFVFNLPFFLIFYFIFKKVLFSLSIANFFAFLEFCVLIYYCFFVFYFHLNWNFINTFKISLKKIFNKKNVKPFLLYLPFLVICPLVFLTTLFIVVFSLSLAYPYLSILTIILVLLTWLISVLETRIADLLV